MAHSILFASNFSKAAKLHFNCSVRLLLAGQLLIRRRHQLALPSDKVADPWKQPPLIWSKWRFQTPCQPKLDSPEDQTSTMRGWAQLPEPLLISIFNRLTASEVAFQIPTPLNSSGFGLWASLLSVVVSISRWTSLETLPLQRFVSQVFVHKVASDLFSTTSYL